MNWTVANFHFGPPAMPAVLQARWRRPFTPRSSAFCFVCGRTLACAWQKRNRWHGMGWDMQGRRGGWQQKPRPRMQRPRNLPCATRQHGRSWCGCNSVRAGGGWLQLREGSPAASYAGRFIGARYKGRMRNCCCCFLLLAMSCCQERAGAPEKLRGPTPQWGT